MILNRRNALKISLFGTAASIFFRDAAQAEEEKPTPRSNRFMLYIHMGSICGPSAGLTQPFDAKGWPKGFFRSGSNEGCLNSNVNVLTQDGSLVFHSYLTFLREISQDMCLVSGDPVSQDHREAAMRQQRGVVSAAFAPEWPMGVAQNMRGENRKNPMILSSGVKNLSTPDISVVSARNIKEFQTITRDVPQVPGSSSDPIWKILKGRYSNTRIDSVNIDPALGPSVDYQLKVLLEGMPEIDKIKGEIDTLTTQLSRDSVFKFIEDHKCPEAQSIRENLSDFEGTGLRENLILAGALAKSGVASGMTIHVDGGDMHTGGTDVISAKRASASWASITAFWKWIKSVGLDEDVMIICSHEFGRSSYNGSFSEGTYRDASGKEVKIKSYGRDHGKFFGMMFINSKVPSKGRIGNVTDGLTPVATNDAKGTIDTSKSSAYLSTNIVGSMLMRVYDDLFPTERIVRKHWPSFIEIDTILKAK